MSNVRLTIGPTCWKEIDVIPTSALGSSVAGGFLICKAGGVGWIVAPSSTQVTRTWDCRNDAVTTANANAACGDWFVPTVSQSQNPGYTCRIHWDSFNISHPYWTSTEQNTSHAFRMVGLNGTVFGTNKTSTLCIRAFRCVTY